MFHILRRSMLQSPHPSVFFFQEYLAGRNPQKISKSPPGVIALFADCHIWFLRSINQMLSKNLEEYFASEVWHLLFRSVWQEQASKRSLRTLEKSHFVCKLSHLFFGSIWQEQTRKRSPRPLGNSHFVRKLSHLFFRSIWQEQGRKRSPRPLGTSANFSGCGSSPTLWCWLS